MARSGGGSRARSRGCPGGLEGSRKRCRTRRDKLKTWRGNSRKAGEGVGTAATMAHAGSRHVAAMVRTAGWFPKLEECRGRHLQLRPQHHQQHGQETLRHPRNSAKRMRDRPPTERRRLDRLWERSRLQRRRFLKWNAPSASAAQTGLHLLGPTMAHMQTLPEGQETLQPCMRRVWPVQSSARSPQRVPRRPVSRAIYMTKEKSRPGK
mmetsp:Transcript_76889/g.223252  ORF Transcript_76889/g.223252 Transcript_76889/m.223252 type:complete len:208 (+) Transcript_76889:675-1298(+)